MQKENDTLPLTKLNELHTDGAGFDILRYISIPDLLGTEAHTLLYFMGRNLARKMELTSFDDLYFIFEKIGWGRLELVKEKKNVIIFQLMADSVVYRLNAPFEVDFRLEAGFLAEAVHIINEVGCECMEDVHRKIHQVEFKVIYTD